MNTKIIQIKIWKIKLNNLSYQISPIYQIKFKGRNSIYIYIYGFLRINIYMNIYYDYYEYDIL